MTLKDLKPVNFDSILTKGGNYITLDNNQAWQQVGKTIELWQFIDNKLMRVKRFNNVIATYQTEDN